MRRAGVLVTAAAVLLPLAACGKKGPPLAPLRPVPAQMTSLAGRRTGSDMQIRFTLPTSNASGPGAIDLEEVEIFAITLAPGAATPPAKELLSRKYLLNKIPVRPLPVEEEETPEDTEGAGKKEAPTKPDQQPAEPPDDRPLPGDRVTFVEPLTAAQLTPAVLPKPKASAKAVPVSPPAAIDPPVPTRYYFVRGRSRRGDPGAVSARLALPLVPQPAPPTGIQAKVTETEVTLEWTAPPPAVDPVAAAVYEHASAAANAPLPVRRLPARRPASADSGETRLDPPVLVPLIRMPGVLHPLVVLPAAPSFNVYAVTDGKVEQAPLNTAPVTATTLSRGQPAWGQESCFVVRTVRTYGLVSIESADAGPTCVTPVDTFPPAAPTGLKAVAAAGAINLIWDANREADLAGYLVLRAEAPGETLQPLTPTPITGTNYTDSTVTPGVRYVYAIVAVDKASPANTSPPSERHEDVAR